MDIVRADAPKAARLTDQLTVALAQIEPVWLSRSATLEKVADTIVKAGSEGAGLCVFGEALVPGYPFWVDRTGGAQFESAVQQAWYDQYLDQGVIIERGDLEGVQAAAKSTSCATYLGVMERAPDRSGTTLYCSLVYVNADGEICSVHRKIQPTYEERLVWGMGDGQGLQCHDLGPFKVGGLNCWENWLPLARAALHGMGETLHLAAWPGGEHNTRDLTPIIAKEGRSYVLSVSGLMANVPADLDLPEIEAVKGAGMMANGGSCIASPDGSWIVEPVVGREALILADLDASAVRRARHALDISGHYSRPDILQLQVDRRRRGTISTIDDMPE